MLESNKNYAFVINLKKRVDRLKNVLENYDNKDIYDLIIFNACDPLNLENNSLKVIKELFSFLQKFAKANLINHWNPTAGEVGVWVSHLSIWKKMIDEKISRAIIFEDDIIEFDNNFTDFVTEFFEIDPNLYNIIYLNESNQLFSGHILYSYDELPKEKLSNNSYQEIFRVGNQKHPPLIANGYILSYKGAKILLNEYHKLNNLYNKLPLDLFIHNVFISNNFPVHYSIKPIIKSIDCHIVPIIIKKYNDIFKASKQKSILNSDIQHKTRLNKDTLKDLNLSIKKYLFTILSYLNKNNQVCEMIS